MQSSVGGLRKSRWMRSLHRNSYISIKGILRGVLFVAKLSTEMEIIMNDKTKSIFVILWTGLFGWLGILAIPLLALVSFNLIDYATRLIANKVIGKTNTSKQSVDGIPKKVGMWVLVAACAIIDLVIMQCGEYVGVTLPIKFILAIIVSIWLIFNEFISILENVRDMGTKVPKFILNLADKILGKAEAAGQAVVDSIDKEDNKDEGQNKTPSDTTV